MAGPPACGIGFNLNRSGAGPALSEPPPSNPAEVAAGTIPVSRPLLPTFDKLEPYLDLSLIEEAKQRIDGKKASSSR